MAMLLVTTVVLMMMLVVTIKSVELREKRQTYMEREEEALVKEIEAEQLRSEEIAEYGKYTQTKKFVEEVAKEKLGLVYEGEIIFKDEK